MDAFRCKGKFLNFETFFLKTKKELYKINFLLKDNSVRLWEFKKSSETMICLVAASRHTASVTTVCFSQITNDFFLSASEDTTLKLWSITYTKDKETKLKDCKIMVKFTTVAHQKDINCVCISPNDKIVATGSQDKSVKVSFSY